MADKKTETRQTISKSIKPRAGVISPEPKFPTRPENDASPAAKDQPKQSK